MDAKFISKMAGEKVEEFVGKTIDNVMGNKEDKKEEVKGGAEQEKPKDDNGFGFGDVLSMVSGGDDDKNKKKKEEEEGGGAAKVMGALGGLFN